MEGGREGSGGREGGEWREGRWEGGRWERGRGGGRGTEVREGEYNTSLFFLIPHLLQAAEQVTQLEQQVSQWREALEEAKRRHEQKTSVSAITTTHTRNNTRMPSYQWIPASAPFLCVNVLG